MNDSDLMFTITVRDVQRTADNFIGRELTIEELQQVKRKLQFDWLNAIELVIDTMLEEKEM